MSVTETQRPTQLFSSTEGTPTPLEASDFDHHRAQDGTNDDRPSSEWAITSHDVLAWDADSDMGYTEWETGEGTPERGRQG